MKRTRYKAIENFLHALEDEDIIKPYVYTALNGKKITIYCSFDPKSASLYGLTIALYPTGYFCNGTAIYFHNLTKQVPSTIHVCHETIPGKLKGLRKDLNDSTIRQEFLKEHRHTKYVFQIKGIDIVVVDRRTGSRFGVVSVARSNKFLPKGSSVTCLERALIDAVINPHYNGGIGSVYSYFREGGRRIDVNKLIEIYRQMGFVYPYSQTIGFFMDRLGMQDNARMIRKAFPPKHMFYVDRHAKSSWIQDKTWRISYPKGLVDEN